MGAHARDAGGMPIAAYLGFLVALALAAAFVAVVAVVVFLPPRPPDVMRADVVVEQFEAGYRHWRATGGPINGDGMAWRVVDTPPPQTQLRHLDVARVRLAERLGMEPQAVRIAASRIARNERFVFRVREGGDDGGEHADFEVRHHRHDVLIAPDPPPHTRRLEVQIERGEGPAAPPPLPPSPPVAPAPPLFAPAPPGVMLVSGVEVGARLDDGRWLIMRQGRNWAELSWIGTTALIIAATLAVVSLLALWFARRITRPIRSFADAVQAVGVDPGSAPVRAEGPAELRGAAVAVNAMQARLRALIADRTKTLATVAHDMRTPLMRLRLAAENVAPEQRERMAKEIGEVEALVASFIAFARDDPAEEARVRIDLSALLQSLADDAVEAGREVLFEGEERVIVTGQPLGLKRLFANLIDNAVKYGQRARVTLARQPSALIVEVADDGPGIPESEREAVFEPFVRLARGESGAGLGLPAARSIARAHGGEVAIADGGPGARVRVSLPD